jgi:hypothetical protein
MHQELGVHHNLDAEKSIDRLVLLCVVTDYAGCCCVQCADIDGTMVNEHSDKKEQFWMDSRTKEFQEYWCAAAERAAAASAAAACTTAAAVLDVALLSTEKAA